MLNSNRRSFLTSLLISPVALFAKKFGTKQEKLPVDPDAFKKYVSACLNAKHPYPNGGLIYNLAPGYLIGGRIGG